MKYKVVANEVVMAENVTCLKALNMVIGIMQGNREAALTVKVFYQAGNETVGYCWKLENSFTVEGPEKG